MAIESKRADKKKNQAKVIKELIKNPSLTERELAKKAWISKTSAHNHKEELGQIWPKGEILARVLENDKEIMDLVAWLNVREFKKISKKEWVIELNDLKIMSDIAEKSTKRYAIFWDKEWKATWNVIIIM